MAKDVGLALDIEHPFSDDKNDKVIYGVAVKTSNLLNCREDSDCLICIHEDIGNNIKELAI